MKALPSALRAAKRALEVFRRVGVMTGDVFGVVAIECAIDGGVIRLAREFVAVNGGIQRARYEWAVVIRLAEIQLQFLVGKIGVRKEDAIRVLDLLRKYPENLQFPNEIRKPHPKKR